MVRLLALAVESGFALHTNRNFGPFYPPVVVDPISVLPGVNLARHEGAHWLFLRPHVGHIISWGRAIQILSELSGHLRWVADRLGGARGRGQVGDALLL